MRKEEEIVEGQTNRDYYLRKKKENSLARKADWLPICEKS